MGSKTIQGDLWGRRPCDWASVQEQTANAGYEYVLNYLKLTSSDNLLDIGCGSGIFCNLARMKGATVTGIDASEKLIEKAKERNPSIKFSEGEMEELPFESNSFNIVCGFNSFQYAANIKNALSEAKRVLISTGKLAIMIWGNKEDCEAAGFLKAVGDLLPPPPPGAAGPFALSENQLLEKTLDEIALRIVHKTDVTSVWDYKDMDTALKGLISGGPVARAIDNSGYEKVYETIKKTIQPHIQRNGHLVLVNKFRVVISERN